MLSNGSLAELAPKARGAGSGSGRPGARLRRVLPTTQVAAVDFGHHHIHTAIADASGTALAESRLDIPVDVHAVEAINLAADMLIALADNQRFGRLANVVAGIPGPLHSATGVVSSPTILPGWVGLAPAAELARRLGAPVHAENDAFLGAYGELFAGAGRGRNDFLYVKVSHGVGACPVIRGHPYRGAVGIAGEIGHTHLDGQNEVCRCGQRGCLETAVSIHTVRRQIALAHPELDITTVALTELDDPITRRILEDAGQTLGRVLADHCTLLNPAAIILGGELGTAGPSLIDGVRSAVRRYALPGIASAADVVPAALGVRAEVTGALKLAAKLVKSPTA